MLKKILLAVVVIVGLLLAYIAGQSEDFTVSRELLIKTTPEIIFPYINNSQKSNEWMPWQESDPNAKMIYSGPDEGVGSTTTWDSTGNMGTGKAEVVESIPNQRVRTQLSYTKPMNMEQLAEITLTPSAQGTMVKWSVTGKNSFVGRIFCFFFNMDKMVGGEFEKGLNKLKGKVEEAAR